MIMIASTTTILLVLGTTITITTPRCMNLEGKIVKSKIFQIDSIGHIIYIMVAKIMSNLNMQLDF